MPDLRWMEEPLQKWLWKRPQQWVSQWVPETVSQAVGEGITSVSGWLSEKIATLPTSIRANTPHDGMGDKAFWWGLFRGEIDELETQLPDQIAPKDLRARLEDLQSLVGQSVLVSPHEYLQGVRTLQAALKGQRSLRAISHGKVLERFIDRFKAEIKHQPAFAEQCCRQDMSELLQHLTAQQITADVLWDCLKDYQDMLPLTRYAQLLLSFHDHLQDGLTKAEGASVDESSQSTANSPVYQQLLSRLEMILRSMDWTHIQAMAKEEASTQQARLALSDAEVSAPTDSNDAKKTNGVLNKQSFLDKTLHAMAGVAHYVIEHPAEAITLGLAAQAAAAAAIEPVLSAHRVAQWRMEGGKKTFSGDYHDTIYSFNRGDGEVSISDMGGHDVIQFGEGIHPEDVSCSRSGDNLVCQLENTNDAFTVTDHFALPAFQIESMQFFDQKMINIKNLLTTAETFYPSEPNSESSDQLTSDGINLPNGKTGVQASRGQEENAPHYFIKRAITTSSTSGTAIATSTGGPLTFIGGSEFRVNANVTGDQYGPMIASFVNGNFIITWEDPILDGSFSSVHGQRFDVAGNFLGNNFQINNETYLSQHQCTVATFTNNNFITIWSSWNQDGDLNGIFGKLYDGLGNPLGSEFQVNTYTTNHQEASSVAVLTNDDFVVVWESMNQDGDNNGIYGQRFDKFTNPLGSEFRVNTYTTNIQRQPDVAPLDNGNFVVVWQSFGQDSDDFGIYGQLFNNTAASQGSEFQVNNYTTGIQLDARTVSTAGNGFIVVFGNADLGNVEIHHYNGSGNPLGSSPVPETSGSPSITRLLNDEFILAFDSWGTDGSQQGIRVLFLDASGNIISNSFPVNVYTINNQRWADIAGLSNGDFAVTWYSYNQDGDQGGIYGRTFQRSTLPLSSTLTTTPSVVTSATPLTTAVLTGGVSTTASIAPTSTTGPATLVISGINETFIAGNEFIISPLPVYIFDVASFHNGEFIAVFDKTEIYAQRFDGNGDRLGSDFQVNTETGSTQYAPSVAVYPNDNFVVAWESWGQDGSAMGVFGQQYDAQANPMGSEFQINTYTLGGQYNVQVDTLSNNSFVAVWSSDQDGDGQGIYGQRFNFLGFPLGSEFRVNTYTTGNQDHPKIAALSNGGFSAIWDSFGQDGDNYGVYGQVFDEFGVFQGSEFRINVVTTGIQKGPDITGLSNGGFMVTWDGGSFGSLVKFRLYDNVGNPLTSEIFSTDAGKNLSIDELADGDGNIVTVWGRTSIQFLSNSGSILSNQLRLNNNIGNDDQPQVSGLSNGDFVIMRHYANQTGAESLHGRVFHRVITESLTTTTSASTSTLSTTTTTTLTPMITSAVPTTVSTGSSNTGTLSATNTAQIGNYIEDTPFQFRDIVISTPFDTNLGVILTLSDPSANSSILRFFPASVEKISLVKGLPTLS